MTLLNACYFNNMSLNYYYYLILCQRLFLSQVEERNLSSRWNSVFLEHDLVFVCFFVFWSHCVLILLWWAPLCPWITFHFTHPKGWRWWCHVNKMGAWMRRCPWLWLILDSQMFKNPLSSFSLTWINYCAIPVQTIFVSELESASPTTCNKSSFILFTF